MKKSKPIKQGIPYADLKQLQEDERIQKIGMEAVKNRRSVGFIVEDIEKADRYMAKLKAAFPSIVECGRARFTQGTWLVRVQCSGSNN